MANYKKIVPFFYKWEGGYVNDPSDAGGETNKGVTYKTWVSFFGDNCHDRFMEMSNDDWGVIFKKGYWDKVKGDDIQLQSIAECLVSWAWGSGSRTAIKEIQRELGVSVDGVIGKNTLKAINESNELELFERCIKRRESFFRKITVSRPENSRFLKGWLNRLADFNKKFKPKNG